MNLIEFIDKTPQTSGTKLNRANLMAVQGFVAATTVFNDDGSILQTNSNGETRKIEFIQEASGTVIYETFTGDLTITKRTIFNPDGSVTEEIV